MNDPESRLRAGLSSIADSMEPDIDPLAAVAAGDRLRRARTTGWLTAGLVLATLFGLFAWTALPGRPVTGIPDPAARTTSSPTSPTDPTDWVVYESKQYGFSIKHPPGWEVRAAERDWTLEADAGRGDQMGEGAEERFRSPANEGFVAVWSAPAKDTPETLEGVAAWVKRYCKKEGSSCSGLDRSVPLCNGTDCYPGLLVTVDNMFGAHDDHSFVAAFFTGGQAQRPDDWRGGRATGGGRCRR